MGVGGSVGGSVGVRIKEGQAESRFLAWPPPANMELESERWKARRNGWANEGERGGANPGRERER